MTALPFSLSARHKGFNRAEIVDQNFVEFVQLWQGHAHAAPRGGEPVLSGSALDAQGFRDLLESQLISRHLDLMARVLRVQNKVFYTIGSSGHKAMRWWRGSRAIPIRRFCTTAPAASWPSASASCRAWTR